MKVRKIKNYSLGFQLHIKKNRFLQHQSILETSENVCFYFMIGFREVFIHIKSFFVAVRNKLLNIY